LLHVCVGNVLTILHICLAVHLRCISGAPGQQYLISLGRFCGNAAKDFLGTSVVRLAADCQCLFIRKQRSFTRAQKPSLTKRKLMSFSIHSVNGKNIAEFTANIVLRTPEEFLQMLMESGTDDVIVHKASIDEPFFDLRTGLAGEMLQKVTNYRMRVAIVGDFSKYNSNSLKAFIAESNRLGRVLFVRTPNEALERLA
jgi:hypothetical protein